MMLRAGVLFYWLVYLGVVIGLADRPTHLESWQMVLYSVFWPIVVVGVAAYRVARFAVMNGWL